MATIRKRGDRFHAQIRRKGYPTQTKSFSDKKQAVTWARQVESKIDLGTFLDFSAAEVTTLSDLVSRYKTEVLPLKRSQQGVLYHLGHVEKQLGKYSVVGLQPSILAQYRDNRLKVVSPQSVIHELSLIQRILNHAAKDWGINLPHGNPVSQVRLPSKPRGRERRPSAEELHLLCSDSTVGKLVTFAVETGMRRGEIASMQWAHINWKAQTLSIPETKTDTPRTIPLSNKALETLSQLPRRIDGQVWGMRPDSITQAFERACKRYSIENLRFHDLRHEATSRFFEKGLNSMEVSSITGHQDLRMLKRYTHIKPESLVNRL